MKKHFSPFKWNRFGILLIVLSLSAGLWLSCSEPGNLPSEPEQTQELAVLSKANPQVQSVMSVQDRYTNALFSNPEVVGTGTGLTEDGKLAIVVYTASEVEQSAEATIESLAKTGASPVIPMTIENVPVVTKVTGRFKVYADPTQRFDRPVPIGVSTGHPDITAGTIGCRVTDGTNVYALSNNHVYANSNDASIGDDVIQPGSFDGGSLPDDFLGTLHDFEPIDFSGGDNIMDAAIAISTTDSLGFATPSDGYGAPGTTTVSASVGQNVQKYGRTTVLTQGEVAEINVTVDVCYESADPFGFNCTKLARFVDQISITPGEFSDGGDSGSLIVTNDSNKNPVGLLFAGSDTRTIANPIDPVLSRFNVSIDDGGGVEPTTDIAVTDISAPTSVVQGDVVDVSVTVANVGNQDVTSDINVTLTDDTDAVTIGTQTITGGLTAGASTTLTFSWDTGSASLGDHTLTASHDFADDDASNDSQSTTVNVSEAGSNMHVGDLDGSSTNNGSTWTATVTITIHDDSHNPVADATITGTWSGGASGTVTGTTDSNGQLTVSESGIPKRNGTVTFTVDDVTHATLTYDATANHDPDGDSNGTSITVSKP